MRLLLAPLRSRVRRRASTAQSYVSESFSICRSTIYHICGSEAHHEYMRGEKYAPGSGASLPDSGASLPASGASLQGPGASLPDPGVTLPNPGVTLPAGSDAPGFAPATTKVSPVLRGICCAGFVHPRHPTSLKVIPWPHRMHRKRRVNKSGTTHTGQKRSLPGDYQWHSRVGSVTPGSGSVTPGIRE